MTETIRRHQNLLICLCLAVVTAAVYWPVCHYGFVNYDDQPYVYQNLHHRDGLTLRGLGWAFTTGLDQWMPITWLARLLEWQCFGTDAGAHHLVNVLFHIANTLLVFGVLKRMTSAPWRSAFVAALFGLHPLHVESVAWVTGLKDVLSMFFGLLTIWAYVKYVEEFAVHGSRFDTRRSPPPTLHAPRSTLHMYYYVLSLVLFVLAVMSKPMMVTLPFVLLLLDYWPLGRTKCGVAAGLPAEGGARGDQGFSLRTPRTREGCGYRNPSSEMDRRYIGGFPVRLLKEKLPFLVPVIVSCVLTISARHSSGALAPLEKLPVGDRVANAIVSYVTYLRQLVWPGGLAVFYPQRQWPADVVTEAGVVLILLSAWVIYQARRKPQFIVGWLWYLGTLVPVIGLVQVGNLRMADRYTYLPFVGLFIMVAWGVPGGVIERPVRKQIIAGIAVVLLGAYAVLCRQQVRYWENTGTLFRHALKVTTNNWVAHYNLGVSMVENGSVAGGPSNILEVLDHFAQAVRINPRYPEAQYNLGITLARLGRIHEAIDHFEQALQFKPNYPIAHYNLGLALWLTGKPQEAIRHYEQAVEFMPDYADAHYNLGLALEQTGRVGDALKQYDRAVRLKTDYPDAQNNLAWLLATLPPADGGDPARAVALAQRACSLTGNRSPAYLDTLAAAYAAAGRFNDAVATAQKAVELARAANQSRIASEIEGHLQLYRAGRPYRRP